MATDSNGRSESALQDLAERIEAADGPDRELDAVIAPLQGLRVVDEGHPIGRMCYDDIGSALLLPRYTSSIDAAMMLIDPRALYAHGSMEDGPFARLCWPQPDGTFAGGYFEANCATVPLSICAAALRARHSQGSSL